MTIAAKHLDPLVGLDIHIILIPSPAGPIPTPLPHPYIGMVLDPMDYVPFLGAAVYINGLPRGQAGTAGIALPPHIPMGGPFAKPPTNESEIFMGSAVVCTEDEPQSFLGCMVLSCQDIGMPPPPRVKRKSMPKSMMLPTTVVLSIPMGMIVLIGGPPTISLMGMGFAAALGALKFLKKLGPIAKLIKKGSDKLHKLAEKLMKKLGLGDGLRNLVHKGICAVTGHPVDIATGKVFTDRVDFELPGPIPFQWERTWFSTSTYQGPLGHGWHHSYDQKLYIDDEVILYQTGDGRHVGLPHLVVGSEYFDRKEKLTFFRDNAGYAIRNSDGHVLRFVPVRGRPAGDIPLVEIQDAVGNKVVLRYDDWGRLAQIVDCAGREINIANDQSGRVIALAAPHPDQPAQQVYVARYAYDAWGNLVSAWDALGQPQGFEYRGHLLVKETDRRGFSFYFAYDGTDETARCARTWGDGGLYDRKLTYDTDASTTVVEDSRGHKTVYVHEGGLVTRSVDALGGVTEYASNDYNEIVKETDPLGQSVTFEYDQRGNVIEMVTPDGATISAEYGARDEQLLVKDELGGEWKFVRDQHKRLLETVNPEGAITQYDHDPRHLVAMVDALGGRSSLRYDGQGNLLELSNPDGSFTRYEYDAWGRILTEIDTNGNRQQRRYDLLSRIEQVIEPDGNVRHFHYDPEGNVTFAQDTHKVTTYTHQGIGRLASCTEAGLTVRFQYDSEEQLVAVVNEHGSVYRFEVDPLGRIVAETTFDGATRRVAYDGADQAIRIDLPGGGSSEFKYDAAGNIIAGKHSDGTREAYTYRVDGELTSATLDGVAVAFELDAMGRVVKETRDKHWVASEYDALGQRIRVTSSFGLDQKIERDAGGDAASVTESSTRYETRFARDRMGLELERQLPGGLRSRWQRDRLGRPIQHDVDGAGQPLRAVTFSWGVDGRLQRLVDAFRGPIEFEHDVLGGLARVRHANGSVEHRMPDAVANLFKSATRSDRGYGPSGQLLWANGPRGNTHYAYDAGGNLVEKREPSGSLWRYEWNCVGYLVRVVRPDGTQVKFKYDALGRRVTKTYRGQTTAWLWDGNVPLHEWVDGTLQAFVEVQPPSQGADAEIKRREAELQEHLTRGPPENRGTLAQPVTWLFEPESFAPMAKLVGKRCESIITNDLGTPVLMVNEAGDKVWAAELDSYGEPQHLEGDRDACPFRFPGQYEDAETGLYYNRYRYYDPDAGEYISQDPMALRAGLRLYAYVNDPNAWVDPLGLVLSNKQMGNAAERAAKQRLAKDGHEVIGSIENKSGHGVDIVTRKDGVVQIHEVKANTSRLNQHQREGADSYARRQSKRANSKGFKHKRPSSRAAAAALKDAIRNQGKISGTVIRYDVDPETGRTRHRSTKEWKACK